MYFAGFENGQFYMYPASHYDFLSSIDNNRQDDGTIQPFDPRTRPWYNSNSKTNSSYIIDPYISKSSNTIVSSIATEIRNSTN